MQNLGYRILIKFIKSSLKKFIKVKVLVKFIKI